MKGVGALTRIGGRFREVVERNDLEIPVHRAPLISKHQLHSHNDRNGPFAQCNEYIGKEIKNQLSIKVRLFTRN